MGQGPDVVTAVTWARSLAWERPQTMTGVGGRLECGCPAMWELRLGDGQPVAWGRLYSVSFEILTFTLCIFVVVVVLLFTLI